MTFHGDQSPPDEPLPPAPFPPGREKPPRGPEPPPVGATEPTLADADVIPPVPPGAPVSPPAPPSPPPPPRGFDFAGTHPPPPPPGDPYPMRFDVAYPERLSRLSVLFRLILLLPPYLLSALLQYLVLFAWPAARVAVICKRKYPRWLFTAAAGYLAWHARFQAYALLQTDRYPSFDPETGPITLEYDYPEPGSLSRWRGILWRLLLLIPHFVVLGFLFAAVAVLVLLAWFAILFTGRFPRGMFDFVTGVSRWQHRMAGYSLGFTDRFPPFSRDPAAGTASTATAVACGVTGMLAAGGITAGIVAAVFWNSKVQRTTVDYADLEAGIAPNASFVLNDLANDGDPGLLIEIARVTDPGDRLVQVLDPPSNEHVVVFEWVITSFSLDAPVDATPARFKVATGGGTKTYGAELVTMNGRVAPVTLQSGGVGILRVVFVVPDDAEPIELRFDPAFHPRRGIVYEFR